MIVDCVITFSLIKQKNLCTDSPTAHPHSITEMMMMIVIVMCVLSQDDIVCFECVYSFVVLLGVCDQEW